MFLHITISKNKCKTLWYSHLAYSKEIRVARNKSSRRRNPSW